MQHHLHPIPCSSTSRHVRYAAVLMCRHSQAYTPPTWQSPAGSAPAASPAVDATTAVPPSSSKQPPGSGRAGRGAKQPMRYADADSDGDEDSPPVKAKGRKQKADSDFEVRMHALMRCLLKYASQTGMPRGTASTTALASCHCTHVVQLSVHLERHLAPAHLLGACSTHMCALPVAAERRGQQQRRE